MYAPNDNPSLYIIYRLVVIQDRRAYIAAMYIVVVRLV